MPKPVPEWWECAGQCGLTLEGADGCRVCSLWQDWRKGLQHSHREPGCCALVKVKLVSELAVRLIHLGMPGT